MIILPRLRNLASRAFRWVSSLITQSVGDIIVKAISTGPTPRHVAFIMDGNRRYARLHNIPPSQGHTDGYYQLSYLLGEWITKTAVECVSIYGWSILNFGRPESEVEASMKLMEEKLEEFLTLGTFQIPRRLLDRHEIRVSIFGRTEMFALPIQKLISKVEDKTRKYNRRFINIYLAYTFADEMTRSIEACVNASIEDGSIITPKDIDMHLDGAFRGDDISMPPVDILVRTSGAKRFSDFLLWQTCGDTQVQFVPTLWPVFGPRDLLPILLDYQRKIYLRGWLV